MGSINRLNIYEKWHPYCISPSGTVQYMTDYLYTNRYETLPVTASSNQDIYHNYGYSQSSGAGDIYYNFYKTLKLYKWEAYIFQQSDPSYDWIIPNHNLCSRNIPMHLLTVEDGVEYIKIPENIFFPTKQKVNIGWYEDEISSNNVYPAESGKAYLRQPEYEAFQNTSSSVWNISHNLNGYVIFECLSSNYERYYPETMKRIDDNNVQITWTKSITGSVGLVLSDEKHDFSSSTTWTINHSSISTEAIVQCFDSNDEFINPESIEFTSDTVITINWSKSKSGYALIKFLPESDIWGYEDLGTSSKGFYGKKSEFEWDGYGILTPHYKVEVDLTDEPLNPNANEPAIINSTTWNDLINAWEETRPAHKVAHYWTLLAPVCDFSGREIQTYTDERYKNYITTIFYQSLQSETPNSYIHTQTTSLKEWTITHNLGTYNILACSYDNDNILLNPTISIVDSNTIKLTHIFASKGKAYIIQSDSSFHQSSSSNEWIAIHPSGSRFYNSRVTDNSYNDLEYTNLQNTTSTYNTIKFSSNKTGYVYFNKGYKYDFDESSTWNLTHNLSHDGYIVDIFDSDWNIISKSEYTLEMINPKSKLIINWTTPTQGRIILTPIRSEYSDSDLIDEIENNGYFMINNDINTWQPLSDGSYTNQNTYLYKGSVTVSGNADYHTIQCDIPSTKKLFEGKVTEIGIFTGNDVFVFYSQFKSIYRKYYTGLRIFLKVSKTNL